MGVMEVWTGGAVAVTALWTGGAVAVTAGGGTVDGNANRAPRVRLVCAPAPCPSV